MSELETIHKAIKSGRVSILRDGVFIPIISYHEDEDGCFFTPKTDGSVGETQRMIEGDQLQIHLQRK